MVQIINLVNKYGLMVVLFLTLIVFFKSCSTSQKIYQHDADSKVEIRKLDSLITMSKQDMVSKSEMIELNNDLMREYTELFYQIQNNKLTHQEINRKFDEIKTKLINNNKQKPNK